MLTPPGSVQYFMIALPSSSLPVSELPQWFLRVPEPVSRTLTPEEAEFRKRFGKLREISDRFNDEMKRAMRRENSNGRLEQI
jgi:hypothetical protein